MHLLPPLFLTVLLWMQALAPQRDVMALAWAVASQAQSEAEAALVTAVAFRESSLDPRAVGDSGRSFCAMQIHRSSGGSTELLDDPEACVARGLDLLRQSIRIDRANPVAWYARGPRWRSDEAQRISRDRVALARQLLASASR